LHRGKGRGRGEEVEEVIVGSWSVEESKGHNTST
jgi:hypothetical protein